MSRTLGQVWRAGFLAVVGALVLTVAGCGGGGENTGITPDEVNQLRAAIMFGEHAKVASMLANRPSLANVKFDDGSCPLHDAAMRGQAAVVKALLEEGADKNREDANGATALGLAAGAGHLEVVKLLVQAGADLNKHGDKTVSPLALANTREQKEVVEYLKSYNAKE